MIRTFSKPLDVVASPEIKQTANCVALDLNFTRNGNKPILQVIPTILFSEERPSMRRVENPDEKTKEVVSFIDEPFVETIYSNQQQLPSQIFEGDDLTMLFKSIAAAVNGDSNLLEVMNNKIYEELVKRGVLPKDE